MKLAYRYIVLVLVVTLPITSGADVSRRSSLQSFQPKEASKPSKLKMKTEFNSVGFSYDEGQDESQVVLFTVRPRGRVEFTPYFGFRFDVGLNLSSSRDQTRFQNPNQDLLNLRQAAGYIKYKEHFDLRLGAISQDHFGNPMFIANRGFPGAYLGTGFKTKHFFLKPKAMYAIPTSSSFENDRSQEEEIPSLTTYGLEGGVRPVKWLTFKSNINQFEFRDLPSIVAFRSNRLGNSVIGTDPSESFFRYEFQGVSYVNQLSLRYHPRFRQSLSAMVIDNQRAPTDRQRSQKVETSFSLDLSKVVITPSFGQFFAESDSVPAFYSAFEFGGVNREGEIAGLALNFKELGFKLKAQYVMAREIEDDPLQNDVTNYSLHLEFNDDIF